MKSFDVKKNIFPELSTFTKQFGLRSDVETKILFFNIFINATRSVKCRLYNMNVSLKLTEGPTFP